MSKYQLFMLIKAKIYDTTGVFLNIAVIYGCSVMQ